VPLEAVVALPVVRLLEVLLPPQPENASVTRTVPNGDRPQLHRTSLTGREIAFQTKLGDLPALGVVDLSINFPALRFPR